MKELITDICLKEDLRDVFHISSIKLGKNININYNISYLFQLQI